MRDDFIIERLRAALRAMEDESPEEWFAKMERLSVLDAEGNVRLRMPEPPEGITGNQKPARRHKPRKSISTAVQKRGAESARAFRRRKAAPGDEPSRPTAATPGRPQESSSSTTRACRGAGGMASRAPPYQCVARWHAGGSGDASPTA
jgi:hypothetical protein